MPSSDSSEPIGVTSDGAVPIVDITAGPAGQEPPLNAIKIHRYAGYFCHMQFAHTQFHERHPGRRLKNKLGTKQLPTAELELAGSRALLVSAPGTRSVSVSLPVRVLVRSSSGAAVLSVGSKL